MTIKAPPRMFARKKKVARGNKELPSAKKLIGAGLGLVGLAVGLQAMGSVSN